MGTETVEDRFKAVGATLKDELRIDAVIAEGGFGLVYRATHLGLDRPVALKVLKTPSEYNDEAKRAFVERFKQEARTVTRVSHPAVVQVLDFGVSPFPNGEEAAWTAMEWIEGGTLEDELRARRKQGGRHPIDAMALLRPVLEAVAVAHDEGIAHRDLKPANIMVVRGKRTTTVRLLDFGIAKLMDAGEEAGSGFTRTSSSMVACSPRYAAPEQLSSSRTGPWSDVHALAMILSEVLTDRVGYAGKDTTSVFAEALSPTRPTPAKRSIDVGAWEPVLLKALSLRPDDRYANAGDLLAALDAALPGATHPKAPELDVTPSATGPRPSTPNVPVSAPALAETAVPSPSRPIVDDDDDLPPPAPFAGGTLDRPTPAPLSLATQELPAPVVAVTPSGNTTLRGMSSNSSTPVAPAAPRNSLAIVAGVAALVVLAAVGFALTRPGAPSAAAAPPSAALAAPASPPAAPPPPAPAPPPPEPAIAAPAPPVSDGGVEVAAAAAPAVTAAPAEAPEAPRHRSRHRRSSRRSNTAPQGYEIE